MEYIYTYIGGVLGVNVYAYMSVPWSVWERILKSFEVTGGSGRPLFLFRPT